MSFLDQHYVYHLFDKYTDQLLYVGRTVNPKARRRIFERRTGLEVSYKVFKCKSFEAAQRRELRDIDKFSPPFNKYRASSPTRLGMRNSKQHCAALSAGRKGRHLTNEHKAKLWAERTHMCERNSKGQFVAQRKT